MESTNITATVVSKRDKNPTIRQTQTRRSTQLGSPYFSVNWGRLQELLDQSREEKFAVNHIEHSPKQNAVQREDDEMNKKRMSNTYKQARTWPITKAALMFVAQQQGILENLKKKWTIIVTN